MQTEINRDFLQAFSNNNFNEMSTLLNQGADINTTSEYGKTALMSAVTDKHVECADFLIKNGANIDYQTINTFIGSQYTPLMYAIESGSKECVELLLKSGANIHLTNKFKRTALHIVCEHTNVEENSLIIAQLLVQYGAKINVQDDRSNTPLITACCRIEENIDLVKLLLENNADVHIRNFKNESIMDMAKRQIFNQKLIPVIYDYKKSINEQKELSDMIDDRNNVLSDSPLIF